MAPIPNTCAKPDGEKDIDGSLSTVLRKAVARLVAGEVLIARALEREQFDDEEQHESRDRVEDQLRLAPNLVGSLAGIPIPARPFTPLLVRGLVRSQVVREIKKIPAMEALASRASAMSVRCSTRAMHIEPAKTQKDAQAVALAPR